MDWWADLHHVAAVEVRGVSVGPAALREPLPLRPADASYEISRPVVVFEAVPEVVERFVADAAVVVLEAHQTNPAPTAGSHSGGMA
ncbi:MAG: hypothetical protein ACRDSJ_18995, partial [Rubrobacteraceae bacterium]